MIFHFDFFVKVILETLLLLLQHCSHKQAPAARNLQLVRDGWGERDETEACGIWLPSATLT